ncbi:Midasin [Giardia muris]|uniref:Midasin n=1 Tax=Giardia muris TaxID=5742 RepID=A0A4Z1SXL7_GIAMU|nr:Midasin [Giardia muris]|eukprot:TNJ30464.1 Midasin [Giardia muris]
MLSKFDIYSSARRILAAGAPLLICGPPASGRTTLLTDLAREVGQPPPVSLHLATAHDARDLLGTYTLSDRPGEFRFNEGPLLLAARAGRWVCIEEITSVSPDALALLISIVRTRSVAVDREIITLHPDFRFIATSTSSPANLPATTRSLFYILCKPSLVPELKELLEAYCCPALATLLVLVFERLSNRIPITVADVFKWAKRLQYDADSGVLSFNHAFHNFQRIEGPCNPNILVGLLSDSARRVLIINAWEAFGLRLSPTQQGCFLEVMGTLFGVSPAILQMELHDSMPLHSRSLQQGTLTCGRVKLSLTPGFDDSPPSLAITKHLAHLMEHIASSVRAGEPVLLMGSTGIGKTTCLQALARMLRRKLYVVNMSSQTDTSDLLGGYVPVTSAQLFKTLHTTVCTLFPKYLNPDKNVQFLSELHRSYEAGDWRRLVGHARQFSSGAMSLVAKKLSKGEEDGFESRRRAFTTLDMDTLNELDRLISQVMYHLSDGEEKRPAMSFHYQEGLLLRALTRGEWILIDEVNLAPYAILDVLAQLLSATDDIALPERGFVKRHPNFRVFAAMNPGTDAGKKDLSTTLRRCFTEINVTDMTDIGDLATIVRLYLHISEADTTDPYPLLLATLYLHLKELSVTTLVTAAGGRAPVFSIRSFCRALSFADRFRHIAGLRRSLYEGFTLSFGSMLNPTSRATLHTLFLERLLEQNSDILLTPFNVCGKHNNLFYQHPTVTTVPIIKSYSLPPGPAYVPDQKADYVLTETTSGYLLMLTRAVAASLPVLLEGSTSSGKTSLIRYLARILGYKVVRINNHEHTDLAEYFGNFQPDPKTGQLSFQDGPLVTALRTGAWIILDELNMAPSEVLEALNRLLDDNKELLIPETQEIIHPAPGFMLFATQNPSGAYAGRKLLSDAFRNRFISIEFVDFSDQELKEILQQRDTSRNLAPKYIELLVQTVKNIRETLEHRRGNTLPVGTLVTLRDLFRIADRLPRDLEELAQSIFELIGERQRDPSDRALVAEIISKNLRLPFTVDGAEQAYAQRIRPIQELLAKQQWGLCKKYHTIVWTPSMTRLFALLLASVSNNEAPLLVGATGAGKTTSVELLSALLAQDLVQINLHRHTENSDFVGGLRPLRSRERTGSRLQALKEYADTSADAAAAIEHEIARLKRFLGSSLFEWEDGPLLQCMKRGSIMLLDEVSLAEDAVLERLNSVLETTRELLVAENPNMPESIRARTSFKLVATMNPAGDYGKKELSPAMRSRLTELWMPQIRDLAEVTDILQARLAGTRFEEFALATGLNHIELLTGIFRKLNEASAKGLLGNIFTISIRDLLILCEYVSMTNPSTKEELRDVILDAAALALLDGLPIRTQLGLSASCIAVRQSILAYIYSEFDQTNSPQDYDEENFGDIQVILSDEGALQFVSRGRRSRLVAEIRPGPRFDREKANSTLQNFRLDAPTTAKNACRIAKAIAFSRPILLEGDPGVGKSALISSLAQVTGHNLVRINLSEQTDLADLLGMDLPTEGRKFKWTDGPLLRAVQAGDWVLLDELNLANQSVLEGLNPLLDHRRSLYIPELLKLVVAPASFRLFGTQNPHAQGSGRRGLPQSFVSRFLNVHVSQLGPSDYHWIVSNVYPSLPEASASWIVSSMQALQQSCNVAQLGVLGGPWEINVRDLMRLCDLIVDCHLEQDVALLEHYFRILFVSRFRTLGDLTLAESLTGQALVHWELRPLCLMTDEAVTIGKTKLSRSHPAFRRVYCKDQTMSARLLTSQLPAVEATALAIQQNLCCLLVGSSENGKSSIIRFLAEMTRNPLFTIDANMAMDVSDLVGCYEQLDVSRELSELLQDLTLFFETSSKDVASISSYATEGYETLQMQLQTLSDTSHTAGNRNTLERLISDYCMGLLKLLIRSFLPEHDPNEITLLCELPIPTRISLGPQVPSEHELIRQIARLVRMCEQGPAGTFVWRDSLLIRALERGYWVEITNPNYCMPAVLDRLNSLLERGGTLDLLEQGLERTRSISIHPNFRLFFTHAPELNISRALRNRSLELCLDTLNQPINVLDLVRCVAPIVSDVPTIHAMVLCYSQLGLTGLTLLERWATLQAKLCTGTTDEKLSPEQLEDLQRTYVDCFIYSSNMEQLREERFNIFLSVRKYLEGELSLDAVHEKTELYLTHLTPEALQFLLGFDSTHHSLALLHFKRGRYSLSRSCGRVAICLGLENRVDRQQYHQSLVQLTGLPASLLSELTPDYADLLSKISKAILAKEKPDPLPQPFAPFIDIFFGGAFSPSSAFLLLFLIDLAMDASDGSLNDRVPAFFGLLEEVFPHHMTDVQKQTLRRYADNIIVEPSICALPPSLISFIRSILSSGIHIGTEKAWLSVRFALQADRITALSSPDLITFLTDVIAQVELRLSPEGDISTLICPLERREIWADLLASGFYFCCRADCPEYGSKLAFLQATFQHVSKKQVHQMNELLSYVSNRDLGTALTQAEHLISLLRGCTIIARVSETLAGWGGVAPSLISCLFRALSLYDRNSLGPIRLYRGALVHSIGAMIRASQHLPAALSDHLQSSVTSIFNALTQQPATLLSWVDTTVCKLNVAMTRLLCTALGVDYVDPTFGNVLDLIQNPNPLLEKFGDLCKKTSFQRNDLPAATLILSSFTLFLLTSPIGQRDPVVTASYRRCMHLRMLELLSMLFTDIELHALSVDGAVVTNLSKDPLFSYLMSLRDLHQTALEECEQGLLPRNEDATSFFDQLGLILEPIIGYDTLICDFVRDCLSISGGMLDPTHTAPLEATEAHISRTLSTLLPNLLDLSSHSKHFLDITLPIATSLAGLRVGISALVAILPRPTTKTSAGTLIGIAKRIFVGTDDEFLATLYFDSFIRQFKTTAFISDRLLSTLAASLLNFSDDKLLLSAILTPTRLASLAAQAETAEAEGYRRYLEDHSLFRTRLQSSTAEGASDEEELQTQINALFPRHSTFFTEERRERPIYTRDLASYRSAETTNYATTADAIVFLGHCLLYLYGRTPHDFNYILQRQVRHNTRETLFLELTDRALALSDDFLDTVANLQALPTMAIGLADVSKMLQSHAPNVEYAMLKTGKTRRSIRCRDIYRTPYPYEAKQFCSGLLADIHARATRTLEFWPENPLLLEIKDICKRIGALSIVEDPLIVFLSGAEVLITRLEVWDKNTPREYKFIGSAAKKDESLTVALRTLIVMWRRIELMSWNDLFDSIQRQFTSTALTYWPELLVGCLTHQRGVLDGSADSSQFYSEMRDFLLTSPLGEFATRRHILQSISCLLSSLPEMHYKSFCLTSDLLKSLCDELDDFSIYMVSAFENRSKEVRQKFNDQIRIFEWDERSTFVAKVSTDKSHKLCTTLLREYTEVLQFNTRALYVEHSSRLDRLTANMVVRKIEQMPQGLGHIFNRLNYCVESLHFARQSSEKQTKNEKMRILADVLAVVREVLGVSDNNQSLPQARDAYLLTSLQSENVGNVVALIDEFTDAMANRSSEIEQATADQISWAVKHVFLRLWSLGRIHRFLSEIGTSHQSISTRGAEFVVASQVSFQEAMTSVKNWAITTLKIQKNLQTYLTRLPSASIKDSAIGSSQLIENALNIREGISILSARLILHLETDLPLAWTTHYQVIVDLVNLIKVQLDLLKNGTEVINDELLRIPFLEEIERLTSEVIAGITTLQEQSNIINRLSVHTITPPSTPLAPYSSTETISDIIHGGEDFIDAYTEIYAKHVCTELSTLQKPCRIVLSPWHPEDICLATNELSRVADAFAAYTYPLISGAIALLRTGFHVLIEEEEEELQEDNQTGLGLGSGTGDKDVSKEAAKELCEDDLIGQKDENDPQETSDQKDNEGIDMENDFGGLSESIHEEGEEQEDNDKEEEDELDREMGDEQGDAVNERKYNKDENTAPECSDSQKDDAQNSCADDLGNRQEDEEDPGRSNNSKDDNGEPSAEPEESQVDASNKNIPDENSINSIEITGDTSDNDEDSGETEPSEASLEAEPKEEVIEEAPSDEDGLHEDDQAVPIGTDESTQTSQDGSEDHKKAAEAIPYDMQEDSQEGSNMSASICDASEADGKTEKETKNTAWDDVENAADQWEAEDGTGSEGEGAPNRDLQEGCPDQALEDFRKIWQQRLKVIEQREVAADAGQITQKSTVQFDEGAGNANGALGFSHTNIPIDLLRELIQEEQRPVTQDEENNTKPTRDNQGQVDESPEDSMEEQELDAEYIALRSEMRLNGTQEQMLTSENDTKESALSSAVEALPEAMQTGIALLPGLLKDVSAAAFALAEQLRIILEPTTASDLRGDFRSGKKLNLRRIIQFIASDFQKDKIWLRRTKPSKRTYQIMIAIDDSHSMSAVKTYALQTIVMLYTAFRFLEVGQIGVTRFGSTSECVLPLSDTYSDSMIAQAIGSLNFLQDRTDFVRVLESCSDSLEDAKRLSHGNGTMQLILIISDGRILERNGVSQRIRQCLSRNQLPILIILDMDKQSVTDIQSVQFVRENGKSRATITRYLDDFPFQCYAILRDLSELPTTLSTVVRHWIEIVTAFTRS